MQNVPPLEVMGQTSARDLDYLAGIEKLLEGRDPRHLLALWPAYVQRVTLLRFLAHYELFRHVHDLPGCIVEVGVGRGQSFFTWHKLLEIFCANDRFRKVIGFEWFRGLEDFTEKDGTKNNDSHYTDGGWMPPEQEMKELLRLANLDNIIAGSQRSIIVSGDAAETIPEYVKDNPGLRIALLHIDCDQYRPTMAALHHLMPLVVTGGVVAFDEYGLMPWAGETNAVDEYFALHPPRPRIRKFPWSSNPHGFFVKE